MQEDFLHYVWKHQAFLVSSLKTTEDDKVVVVNLGQHNYHSGPDFFNAQVRIDDQLWAGNVEIHIKSSDWYLHNHEKDKAYDNVILHVVWEHDSEIFRKDNSKIPTLELKNYVDQSLVGSYQKLIESKSWINCESDLQNVDNFIMNNWLERLFVERLEKKSEDISMLLKESHNDWEGVLFKMFFKNFGLKVNGESFLSIANSIDYSIIRKLQNDASDLEALFFGMSGLLERDIQESYFKELQRRSQFLKNKFKLNTVGIIPIQFFRLRPSNFPTIRLSQLAQLYAKEHQLFSKIVTLNALDDFYKLFNVSVTQFWKTHYTFSKASRSSKKHLTKTFIDLLVINTIIPIKFSYAKSQGKLITEDLFKLIKQINIESNSIVDKFLSLKVMEKDALNSQALLELKTSYCDKNKCLQCAVGNSLIVRK